MHQLQIEIKRSGTGENKSQVAYLQIPEKIKKLYPKSKSLAIWFFKARTTPLIEHLGLEDSEIEEFNLIDNSNQVIRIYDRDDFLSEIRRIAKQMAGADKPYRREEEKIKRFIFSNSKSTQDLTAIDEYFFDKPKSIRIPEGFTNFINGGYVLIEYKDKNGITRSEVWEEDTWNKIKHYLLEHKRLDRTDLKLISNKIVESKLSK